MSQVLTCAELFLSLSFCLLTMSALCTRDSSFHSFNEPDLDSQSNINATEAARIWKLSMEPFAGKAKLISPAITNGGSPMGVQWMCDFLAACTGCHIDGIAMHIYDGAWVSAVLRETYGCILSKSSHTHRTRDTLPATSPVPTMSSRSPFGSPR